MLNNWWWLVLSHESYSFNWWGPEALLQNPLRGLCIDVLGLVAIRDYCRACVWQLLKLDIHCNLKIYSLIFQRRLGNNIFEQSAFESDWLWNGLSMSHYNADLIVLFE